MSKPPLDKPPLNVRVPHPIKHSRVVKVHGREVEVAYRSGKPPTAYTEIKVTGAGKE